MITIFCICQLYSYLGPFFFLHKRFSQSIFVAGVSTTLRMCYRGYGYPLTLFLEEGGVVTVCKINTQEPEEPIDFDFCTTNVTNKVEILYRNVKLRKKLVSSFTDLYCYSITLTSVLFFLKVILLSESLKEAFSELDMSSEVLQITMSPSQPFFRFVFSV